MLFSLHSASATSLVGPAGSLGDSPHTRGPTGVEAMIPKNAS
jgi:hypothetical protein